MHDEDQHDHQRPARGEHDHPHSHDRLDQEAIDRDFDARAATWDDDASHVDRARRAAAAIAETVPLTSATRVLDYGTGTGLLAQFLAPDTGPMTLADPSAGMRAVLADKVAAGVLRNAEVVDLDLTRDPVPDRRYDLVTTLMALHHVAEPPRVLRAMARMLDPGGWVAIVDLDAEDGSFHGDGFEGPHGFERAALTGWLTDAGFDAPTFAPCGHVRKHDRDYPLFLATAQRRG